MIIVITNTRHLNHWKIEELKDGDDIRFYKIACDILDAKFSEHKEDLSIAKLTPMRQYIQGESPHSLCCVLLNELLILPCALFNE